LEKQELQRLFNLYLEKKASPEEVKILLDHFGVNQDGELLHDLILQEIKQPIPEDNIISLQDHKVYERVESALNARIDHEDEHHHKIFWQTTAFRAIASVAAVALLISGYFILSTSSPVKMMTVSAAYGKQIEIQLPDSSNVWLSAGSTIVYPEKFKKDRRLVELKSGDVFLDVKHDAKTPFIIKAKDVDVTVLGTSFEVNAFEKGKNASITVKTGKVGVVQSGQNKPATFLLPGDRAIINYATHHLHKIIIDTADIAAWRSGKLIFENQLLEEVMSTLERTYNVKITIANPELLYERVTMRLNHQPLDNIMTAISFSNHFNYKKINEQLIVIR